jgi:multidrug resistance efflux pump
VDALTIRAPLSGVVVTPRVHELAGHRVSAGDPLLRVAMVDSLEARVAMVRAGAANVRRGQVVHLMAYDHSAPAEGTVQAVSPAGSNREGTLEVRVPLGPLAAWRAGTTGEASVELRRSTALGALWWNVRQRIRGDILL